MKRNQDASGGVEMWNQYLNCGGTLSFLGYKKSKRTELVALGNHFQFTVVVSQSQRFHCNPKATTGENQ